MSMNPYSLSHPRAEHPVSNTMADANDEKAELALASPTVTGTTAAVNSEYDLESGAPKKTRRMSHV